MYLDNSYEHLKSVTEIKQSIPDLNEKCERCREYFMKPRTKSIKGLDVQMGMFLEDLIIDYLSSVIGVKAIHGDKLNKKYPDCMVLKPDKQIAAYFEVKYHCAPFLTSYQHIGRPCYEGSATLDFEKVIKQIEIIESDLDRPTFYLHWIDYPCLKGIFFETSEQVKDYLYETGIEFERKEREGDFTIVKKVGYTNKVYSPLLYMGNFDEFISYLTKLVREK